MREGCLTAYSRQEGVCSDRCYSRSKKDSGSSFFGGEVYVLRCRVKLRTTRTGVCSLQLDVQPGSHRRGKHHFFCSFLRVFLSFETPKQHKTSKLTGQTQSCRTTYKLNSPDDSPQTDQDNTALFRSDFFPGLGWMLPRRVWEELSPNWPDAYWDDWLRDPDRRRGRQFIRPEVCRTYHFGQKVKVLPLSRGCFFYLIRLL